MNCYKKKGTTLVEVIVAIAILAMVGVAVMDAFNISNKVNRKAKVIDNANVIASNYLQEFKVDPQKFINDRLKAKTISSSEKKDPISNNDIMNYSGKYYYDYKWNLVNASVPNGFTLDYSINEDANIGESTMFKPVGTVDDEKYCFEKNINQYLLYVQDIPRYSNWSDSGDMTVVLIKGWTYDDFYHWLYDENSSRGTYYQHLINTYGTEYGIKNYKDFKAWGYYYFSYYGVTTLKNNNSIVKNVGKDLFKKDCDGVVSVKIDKNDLDLSSSEKYNLQIVNDSRFDVQLYISGDSQADVDAINDKVEIELKKGVATKTIVNEGKLASSNYDMTVNITSNIDGKQVYKLSSKEYLVK